MVVGSKLKVYAHEVCYIFPFFLSDFFSVSEYIPQNHQYLAHTKRKTQRHTVFKPLSRNRKF